MPKVVYFYKDGQNPMYFCGDKDEKFRAVSVQFHPAINQAMQFAEGQYVPQICKMLLRKDVKDKVFVIRYTTNDNTNPANAWYLHKTLAGGGTNADRRYRAEFNTRVDAINHLPYVYRGYVFPDGIRTNVHYVWIEEVEV